MLSDICFGKTHAFKLALQSWARDLWSSTALLLLVPCIFKKKNGMPHEFQFSFMLAQVLHNGQIATQKTVQ
jgi:hypothetical protein